MSVFASKFFTLLRTFDDGELKSFESFLSSAWCNSNKNLPVLLKKVRKYHPAYDNEKLTKERLFKQVLPAGKYSDRRMNNLLSEAYRAAEKFTVYRRLEQDEQLQHDLLLQDRQARRLEDWFFKTIDREIDKLESQPLREWEEELQLLLLYRRKYHHSAQKQVFKDGYKLVTNMMDQLNMVYLMESAVVLNEKLNRGRILKENHAYLREEKRLWTDLHTLYGNDALKYFELKFESAGMVNENLKNSLFELLMDNWDYLNTRQRKIQLFSLLNDSALLFKNGKHSAYQILQLYKLGLSSGTLLTNNIISPITFINAVSLSMGSLDFDFGRLLIDNFSENLPGEVQKEGKQWARAKYFYYQGEFEKSRDILIKCKPTFHAFQKTVRVLTLQNYFELALKSDRYEELLYSYIDAFEKWLYRNTEFSQAHKKAYTRFVQLSRILISEFYKPEFDDEKVLDLLKNEHSVQLIPWLEKQRDKILKMRSPE